MPQTIPFYFINQLSFSFFILFCLIFVLSKYILPRYLTLYITRLFIIKF